MSTYKVFLTFTLYCKIVSILWRSTISIFLPKVKTLFSKKSSPPNRKVLLLGEDSHSCDNVRVFLESNRIEYKHVKNIRSDAAVPLTLEQLYLHDASGKPNVASIVFCSYRNVPNFITFYIIGPVFEYLFGTWKVCTIIYHNCHWLVTLNFTASTTV